ncbi:hypothetical protein [Actinomadura hallensis]|uniref:hypothetical protein n=1 Tax=Actinomadura hallensis TaxID=337895 RepID=UPI00114F39F4|nr:hypothetical protein [Actinomadura hallensis]
MPPSVLQSGLGLQEGEFGAVADLARQIRHVEHGPGRVRRPGGLAHRHQDEGQLGQQFGGGRAGSAPAERGLRELRGSPRVTGVGQRPHGRHRAREPPRVGGFGEVQRPAGQLGGDLRGGAQQLRARPVQALEDLGDAWHRPGHEVGGRGLHPAAVLQQGPADLHVQRLPDGSGNARDR